MDKIQKYCKDNLHKQNFNSLAIGIINFKASTYQSYSFNENENTKLNKYFDLASVSKPLNLSAYYFLSKGKFSQDQKNLLNHQAGLPAWGRLDRQTWRKQLLGYKISKSNTLYSDFSALRLMLEIEKETALSMSDLIKVYLDKELFFWKDLYNDLNKKEYFVPTGFRNGKLIQGEVHDDNSFVLKCYTTHAGMFSSVNGLAKSLINLNQQTDFIKIMKNDLKGNTDRFVNGWDTSRDEASLAGLGCSQSFTFGHLGFTGTSVWIDCEKNIGQIILSNETIKYWYDRRKLNIFRRELGTIIWNEY